MKRSVVAVIGGVALVLAVGVGVGWWLTRAPSVQDAADSYLRALSDADLAAVEDFRSDELGGEAERIVEEAFLSADSYISDARILQITESDGVHEVRASVTLGSDRRELAFALRNSSGRWVVTGDGLGTIRVVTSLNGTDLPAGDSVRIGDALAPAGTRVSVLPAVYTVSAAPRDLLSGSESVVVGDDRSVDVAVAATLAPEATDLAQDRVDAYAEQCALSAPTVPDSCGLRVPWAADLTQLDGIAFRIEQVPTVSIAPDGRTFAATGGIIVATATGPARSGSTGSFTYRSDEWALRGSVALEGDEMILAVG